MSVCVQVAGTAQAATEVLCLMNMVTKEELEDDEEFEGAASFWRGGGRESISSCSVRVTATFSLHALQASWRMCVRSAIAMVKWCRWRSLVQ